MCTECFPQKYSFLKRLNLNKLPNHKRKLPVPQEMLPEVGHRPLAVSKRKCGGGLVSGQTATGLSGHYEAASAPSHGPSTPGYRVLPTIKVPPS